MACSPPGSSVHVAFQARILEQVAISFSRGSNPHLLHWRADSLPLSYLGSPGGSWTTHQMATELSPNKILSKAQLMHTKSFSKWLSTHLCFQVWRIQKDLKKLVMGISTAHESLNPTWSQAHSECKSRLPPTDRQKGWPGIVLFSGTTRMLLITDGVLNPAAAS